LSDCNG